MSHASVFSLYKGDLVQVAAAGGKADSTLAEGQGERKEKKPLE